jgi:hypothetical protein
VFTHNEGAEFPYTDYPVRTDWSDAMATIERLAVEVDAEPGYNSGFHVHVGIGHLSPEQQANCFAAFVRWEHVLTSLARGRFDALRHGQNRSVYDDMASYSLFDWLYSEWQSTANMPARSFDSLDDCDNAVTEVDNPLLTRRWRAQMLEIHRHNDRHNNLNVRTRRPTWEFRLWNSTRSAWRMELFTRLSVALVDHGVALSLLDANPGRRGRSVSNAQVDRLRSALNHNGHHECADLVTRQRLYHVRNVEIPSTFSLV